MTKRLCLTLLAILTIFLSGLANKAQAATSNEVKDLIIKTAISMGVDPCVVLGIAKQESNFESHRRSPYGAVGVFQLMPSTARKMGIDPYNLNDNIKGGIMYYQMMYNKFGSVDLALAAYNAGPGNVAKYNGIPPFRETKKFIDIIKTNSKDFESDPLVIKHTTPEPENPAVSEAEVEQKEIIPVADDAILVPDETI